MMLNSFQFQWLYCGEVVDYSGYSCNRGLLSQRGNPWLCHSVEDPGQITSLNFSCLIYKMEIKIVHLSAPSPDQNATSSSMYVILGLSRGLSIANMDQASRDHSGMWVPVPLPSLFPHHLGFPGGRRVSPPHLGGLDAFGWVVSTLEPGRGR